MTDTPTPEREIHVLVRESDMAEQMGRMAPYLYSNFEFADYPAPPSEFGDGWVNVLIVGRDDAGFTASALADRLRSGNFGAKVVA